MLYDSSQRERAELEEELQRCKAELEKLSGRAQVRDRHEYHNNIQFVSKEGNAKQY